MISTPPDTSSQSRAQLHLSKSGQKPYSREEGGSSHDAPSHAQCQLQLSMNGRKLYGRDEEERCLLEAYNRSSSIQPTSDHGSHEVVLISGHAGTGKTCLANTLKPVVTQDGGFFISGKFDRTIRKPYLPFVTAFTAFTDQLLEMQPDRMSAIRKAISEAVGSEGRFLTNMIPSLVKVLGEQCDTLQVSSIETLRRFQFVFCMFVNIICSPDHPLVLFLDDLQWADAASLEMIRALTNMQCAAFLLVGAHRDIEDTMERCLFASVLVDMKRAPLIRMTTISLTNLKVDLVSQLISDILDQSLKETMPLARVVHDQTQGNAFHVLHFLMLLSDQGLLHYSESEWKWDGDEIKTTLDTETVLDLIVRKLGCLSSEVQEALKIASCMGDVIDAAALWLVLGTASVSSSLEHAADAKLLVFNPHTQAYRFAHDYIRQAAFCLIPIEEQDSFRLHVGRKLWRDSSPIALENNIFMVVTLLNRGIHLMKNKKERREFAQLNLRAGLHAVSVSAFPDAAFYLKNGIELLGRNHWIEEYELSLSLYNAAAEVEMCNANFERVKDLITEVFEYGKNIHDKLRASIILMNSMGQQDNMDEARKVGFQVLRELGDPLPNKVSKFTIIQEFMRTKWKLRGLTDEHLRNLPNMLDETKIACSEILTLVFVYSHLSRSSYTPLLAFRTVRACVDYGLFRGSALGFATYGTILCAVVGDMKEGYRMGQLALSLLDRSPTQEMLAKVYAFFYAGIQHWSRPLHECCEPLKYACRIGIETGDIEFAFASAQVYCFHALSYGYSLDSLEAEFNEYARQMKAYKQENVLIVFNILGQIIHNLTGRSKEPSILSGQIMDKDLSLKEAYETNHVNSVAAIHLYSMYLAYFFGNYEVAGKDAEKFLDIQKAPSGTWGTPLGYFLVGLTSFALAKKGITEKHNIAIGRRINNKMKKWAQYSPFNLSHKQKLLEAELESCNRGNSMTVTRDLYDEAIEGASRGGFVQEAALACERASDYLEGVGESGLAACYKCRAHALYLEWGATGKAATLVNEVE